MPGSRNRSGIRGVLLEAANPENEPDVNDQRGDRQEEDHAASEYDEDLTVPPAEMGLRTHGRPHC
jgi:hypothetical protein